jgi:hypothetical protein
VHCKTYGVTPVLIGLQGVGIVKLRPALDQTAASGLTEPEELLDFLIDVLAADNYIPNRQDEPYRRAIWREYLRFQKQDVSDFYSDVEVTVRGEPGEGRDAFVATAESVFADHELKPIVTFEPPNKEGRNPELLIRDMSVVSGKPTRKMFDKAVRKSFSDW